MPRKKKEIKRMKFHQHKYAISIIVILLALISSYMAVRIQSVQNGSDALTTMMFSFEVLTLAFLFIIVSILLKIRDEVHELLR